MEQTIEKGDFQKLGFKAGLEIHQQVDSNKLFCNCPSLVRGEKKDFYIRRLIRASAGETGEVDIAARHEMEKKKIFVYTGDRNAVCLVDLDEDPPKKLNKDALYVALQVSKLLNANIVDEIQLMRKTVVDGSNVSGFQRTMLIAMNGHIETSKGKVEIQSVCLEEESAQKLESENKNETHYNLDRLGVPLIEIATDASIKDPEHAQETAKLLGMILRSTGKVKRGIGTIRQDVNVSIKGHPRIEIKGFQEIKTMPGAIENEVNRQLNEIKAGKKVEAHVRKANADGTTSFLRPMPGASRMYPETDVPSVVPDIKNIIIPKLISDQVEDISVFGLSKDLSESIVKSGKAEFFSKIVNEFNNIKPSFVAEILVSSGKELEKEGYDPGKIKDNDLLKIFGFLNKGEIGKDSIMNLIISSAEGKNIDEEKKKYEMISDKDLEKIIKEIIQKNKNVPAKALIGIVMKELRGKADGKKIVEIVNKLS